VCTLVSPPAPPRTVEDMVGSLLGCVCRGRTLDRDDESDWKLDWMLVVDVGGECGADERCWVGLRQVLERLR
jgi:hypothetical protein